jgi:N-methylhydantoinase B
MVSARPGAALGRWSIALPTVIDTILKALSPAVPHLVPAAHKGDMGGCSFFGFRPDGSRFLLMNIFGGGWGGRPNEDGESAAVSVCQGDVRNTPVELQEIKYPVLIDKHAFRTDSGGAGRYRGGLGLEVAYRMLQPCRANINCERTVDPPWGLHGGQSAATNDATIRRTDGTEQHVLKGTEIEIGAGDVVTFFTAGGGGFGDPRERPAADVKRDVAEGLITPAAAAKAYGTPTA